MLMKKTFLLLLTLSLVFHSCIEKGSEPKEENSVKLAESSAHGKILTDSEGMTLYFFSNDSKFTSSCEGACLDSWPVFFTEKLSVDTGLDANDFGTITREDGSMQTTYKGWPLYYFSKDGKAGDIQGDGVKMVWYVAKPDYSLMYVNAQLVGNDGKNYVVNDQGAYMEGEGRTMYLADDLGNTLYLFTKDKKNMNKFTKEDFSNNSVWPVFHTALERIPSNLDMADFGSIKVHGERDQLTYRGWPLYYFGADDAKGDNKGVSVPNPGVWPIVNTSTVQASE